MENKDKKEFFGILGATGVMYDKALPEQALELYFSSLKDLSLDQVKAAISRHVNHPEKGQFFPKPADIRFQLQGNADTRALLAWTELERAIDRYWPYESVVFDDPIIHAVLTDMGGWAGIGDRERKDWPFVQKEFERRYQGYVGGPAFRFPGHLAGLCERVNERGGYEIPPPKLIGDEQKALQVMRGGEKADRELTAGELQALMGEARRHHVSEDETIQ